MTKIENNIDNLSNFQAVGAFLPVPPSPRLTARDELRLAFSTVGKELRGVGEEVVLAFATIGDFFAKHARSTRAKMVSQSFVYSNLDLKNGYAPAIQQLCANPILILSRTEMVISLMFIMKESLRISY